ncbi:hypothetical protein Pyn_33253 [Prunus yedoensis var. nudiflora]|uniref:Uncharacterized protein n=1 Tax=Prunus yedoensis var. nudiflora TaxID=2094558 RepID=A0A314Y6P9_PRUYE|nr:hypothetical protein Pyn_33253 [Prunus yedoensis var. nudiflora]
MYDNGIILYDVEKENPMLVVNEPPSSKSIELITHEGVHTEPVEPIPAPWVSKNHPSDLIIGNPHARVKTRRQLVEETSSKRPKGEIVRLESVWVEGLPSLLFASQKVVSRAARGSRVMGCGLKTESFTLYIFLPYREVE